MNAAAWVRVGLSRDEYERVVELLGRAPNELELGMVGVMWSEHCSYKSSSIHLRRLPTQGTQVLIGPGENAGILDVGAETALAIRCESHNSPTVIDPFQGAATGVGGIVRDILSVGARPVAVLGSLRFGPPGDARTRELLAGALAGIADYGARSGVSVFGGEIKFEECYEANPLVNVMAAGLVAKTAIVRGRAEGAGNPVFVVGRPTGRDGIHAASLLASRKLDDTGPSDQPRIPSGDPEVKRELIAACLELMATADVVGVNDLGAAGLTSAGSETASRAGQGIEIDVELVPCSEPGMTPYEIMLSETQERMLVIARAGREPAVRQFFTRRGLAAAIIGRVTDDGMFRVRKGDRVVAELPAKVLTEQAPQYSRPQQPPADLEQRWSTAAKSFQAAAPAAANDTAAWTRRLRDVLADPNFACRGPAWQRLRTDPAAAGEMVTDPISGVTVLRLPGSDRGVAMATVGLGRQSWLDPYRGAMLSVASAARRVACAGARPLGLTNCLNMGNPERPHIMWEFSQVIDGMAAAAHALNTPVTGGNVSFYNEKQGRNIFPTPVIGMVGALTNFDRRLSPGWRRPGDRILLLGNLGGSPAGRPPLIDLKLERFLQQLVVTAHDLSLLRSAHDIADRCLAVALAECCFGATLSAVTAETSGDTAAGVVGAEVSLPPLPEDFGGDATKLNEMLFGEGTSSVLVTVAVDDEAAVVELAAQHQVPVYAIGITGGGRLQIEVGAQLVIDAELNSLSNVWSEAMSTWLQ